MAVGVVPAYQSPLIAELFGAHTFQPGTLPNLATAANPADGFSPTRLANGTEVLFIPTAAGLGPQLAPTMAPLWENGLGLVLFRNADAQVLGAIFIHGAIRNEWNAIQRDAYQCLGGIMLFSDDPRENKSETALISDVIRKSTAMTTKWMFIDENLARTGHTRLTNLGGGKSTASHPAGEKGRRDAVAITASVARELGIYISGSDQNMTLGLCTYFAQNAPHNFMGAKDHPVASYAGMADPSPWTALGVHHGMKAAVRLHMKGRKAPIFFQGYGNVGAPMVRLSVGDGHMVSGIIDMVADKLVQARNDGIEAPLFLQVAGDISLSDKLQDQVARYDLTVVRSLVEALQLAPETEILSPNAGPHPLTRDVVDYLGRAGTIRTVVGAANNLFDTIDGSITPLAAALQDYGIFVPNDSETNQMGALSVTQQRIDLSKEGLELAAAGVGGLTELAYEAFLRGIPPQIARDREAKRRFNRLRRGGRAVGGPFPGVDDEADAQERSDRRSS